MGFARAFMSWTPGLVLASLTALGGGGLIGPAQAASLDDTTPADALRSADLVAEVQVLEIEGAVVEVEDEYVPVRHHHLAVDDVRAGTLVGDRLRLVLPGGELDGTKVVFAGTPELQVGDTMLAVLRSNGDDVVRIDAWHTGWFLQVSTDSGPVAATAWRDPVVAVDCTGGVQVARPWSEAPSASGEGFATGPDDVAGASGGGPLFVEDPLSVALPWDALIEVVQACIDAVSPTGSTITGTVGAEGGAE